MQNRECKYEAGGAAHDVEVCAKPTPHLSASPLGSMHSTRPYVSSNQHNGQSLGKQPNSLPGPSRSFPRRVARTTGTHVTAPCSAERLGMTGGQLQGGDGHLEERLPQEPRGPECWVDLRLAFFIRLAHWHLLLVHLCRLWSIVKHSQREA